MIRSKVLKIINAFRLLQIEVENKQMKSSQGTIEKKFPKLGTPVGRDII